MSTLAAPARLSVPRSSRWVWAGCGLAVALAAAVSSVTAEEDAGAAGPGAASPSSLAIALPEAALAGARRREWSRDPLESFRLYSERGLIDRGLTLESLRRGGDRALRPITAKSMGASERRLLSSAFPVAVRQVSERPSCRALFEQLGTDGLLVLGTTIYVRHTAVGNVDLCSTRDAVAYTRVGQQTTVLCPAFGRLPIQRAAVVLLHEALHYAGMTERPGHPAALSSGEISGLVESHCAL